MWGWFKSPLSRVYVKLSAAASSRGWPVMVHEDRARDPYQCVRELCECLAVPFDAKGRAELALPTDEGWATFPVCVVHALDHDYPSVTEVWRDRIGDGKLPRNEAGTAGVASQWY